MIHLTLHRPGWQITSSREEGSVSRFMLWPSQLSRANDYNVEARQFLLTHPDGIDLGKLVSEYSQEVHAFHKWLEGAVDAQAGQLIADYRRCARKVRSVGARAWWNIILQQVVIAGKKDPYAYLDQYLTAEELADVFALPMRSRQQIDRIIEIVDDNCACDDALRKIVYQAFGASDA